VVVVAEPGAPEAVLRAADQAADQVIQTTELLDLHKLLQHFYQLLNLLEILAEDLHRGIIQLEIYE
jgi:hypothetical protein